MTLRNLIKAKNNDIIFNDTDKIWERRTQTKKDLISESIRQMEDIKTCLELTEETVKNIISEIQNKLKRIVESHMYKGNCTKIKADFLMSKMYIY